MKLTLALLATVLCLHPLSAQTEFSQARALDHLKVLAVEIGPRPMGSPAERRALAYAVEKFREQGCDTAYIMEMPYSSRANTTSGIAIGIKYGATGRIIVVGGHIDSAGPEIPGADDDGSGSATVIELARALTRAPRQSTLLFACWGGEEQGLEGSRYFVEHFAGLDSVVLMLQIDMANGDGLIELDPDTHGASAPEWLTRAAVEEFYNLGYSHLRYPTHFFSINYGMKQGSGSDHESFLQAGIPAVDFSTDVGKPIHTPRDIFENFDPRGLQRSGDVVFRLVERFDAGTPSRAVEQYWLLLLGRTPIFVRFPLLWTYAGAALALSIAAFIGVRRRRQPPTAPDRVRWSGFKILLYTFLIVLCGWFSSDVVGLIKGVRLPWLVTMTEHLFLSFIGGGIGIWLVLRWSKHLRLSVCPYVFSLRAMIILWIYLILLGLFNIKLLVEPATALLFVSLSLLFRNSFLKLVFALLAPIWMFRLILSEWSPLIFRTTAMNLPGGGGPWVVFNLAMIVIFTVFLLPFLYSMCAVIRDSRALQLFIGPARSAAAGVLALAIFAGLGTYLVFQPSNDNFWYKNVTVEQSYNMNSAAKEIFVRSGEYLEGLRIRSASGETTFTSRSTTARMPDQPDFDTTWLLVNRRIENIQNGDSTLHNVDLTLVMTHRPYTVSIVHTGMRDSAGTFATPWKYRLDKGTRSLLWYSFPDSVLRIPFSYTSIGADSLKEHIEITFDAFASPMKVEGEMTYVIPRTKYSQTYVYGK